ncbi:hypothetical protein PNEG_04255 [Pneumocystis murina B123]|uniref:DNA repair protein RAD5 n=1 Tax=Pneumocystis murina (strain B123) TaxID=1069680 RepID=A0A0W4ZX38_PNEMU|nr:hypothetical protein PNEG_04255 [Pneumocystis murina B123]KTW32933.1 hypothetical protein PNEG_04255 [Pneumocystis murina B123]
MMNRPEKRPKVNSFYDHEDRVNERGKMEAIIDELKVIIGHNVEIEILEYLAQTSKGNIELALNMYFDKTWEKKNQKEQKYINQESLSTKSWYLKYIGSFGMEGWANVSGTGFLSAGEVVLLKKQDKINEKTKSRQFFPESVSRKRNSRQNLSRIIRFCTEKGIEIGRIPQESAIHISTLLEFKTCSFTASCIYAPDKIKIGDKILLQIACFIHRQAFTSMKEPLFSREDNIYKVSMTEEIREQHRQAILWLLTKVGLEPDDSKTPDSKTIFKEVIKASKNTGPILSKMGYLDPFGENSSDLEEESKELEKEQINFIYKNTKSYDPNMKEMLPSSSFNLELKLDFGNSDNRFYVNPYSGKLTLEFPRADQGFCGGILADEMGLGKTIEILSLIHSNKPVASLNSTPFIINSNASIQSCRTTLVIAPLSLLDQWRSEAEIASKPNSLKIQIYYGTDKSIDALVQCQTSNQPDLLITSYGVVLSEWSQMTTNNKAFFNLFSIDFYRVVLDEAHYIKNRLSKTAKACSSLNAKRRWVLTGTPIVNKLEDLFSLIHFLKIEPWGNFVFWKTFITIPFESKDIPRALNTLRMIFENLILRRTKTTKDIHGNLIIALPSKEIMTKEIILSLKEREIYDFIYTKAKQAFIENSAAGTIFKNYITILTMLLRLRQSCCHPSLIKHGDKSDFLDLPFDKDIKNSINTDDIIDLKDLIEPFCNQDIKKQNTDAYRTCVIKSILEKTQNECSICSASPIVEEAITSCWHMACKSCLKKHIEFQKSHNKKPLCHICRSPIDEQNIYEIIRKGTQGVADNNSRIELRKFTSISSSKLDALIKQLFALKMSDPYAKSIIFSQFTAFLDLVEVFIKRDNFEFLRLDGGMSMKERSIVLEKFRTEKKGLILLVSIKSGSVGLNLTAASWVFILDPWWNFGMENQAIDRVHRIGQTLPVKVVRFIVKDSIEEKMIEICKRKLMLADISVMEYQSRDDVTKQRLEELQALFE